MRLRNAGRRGKPLRMAGNMMIAAWCLACFCFQPHPAWTRDIPDFNYRDNFNPFMPTLVLKYEVAYRLFGINLMHLADALVYATDGEWFNEATGEWLRSYLLVFHLDTLEGPSEIGKGRYSIHNRLATVLLKPGLEPLVFAKRDFLHVDTFFSEADAHNTELFSVEAGRYDYIKKDFLANSTTTNLNQFARLAGQRHEVLRFMKAISALYSGGTNDAPVNSDFTICVFTDNTLVSFIVNITPKLRKIDVLDGKYNAIYFEAEPAPEFSGKGRDLAAWAASFRYVAEKVNDPGLIWLADNTFEFGMIPLRSEFGLKLGSVRCSLTRINLENGLW